MEGAAIALLLTLVAHVTGGVFLVWKILPSDARDELRGWFREDEGGDPRRPEPAGPQADGDGALPVDPPLPDAQPAGVRLREPGRLADHLPPPARRPAHPQRPERVPQPDRR